VQPAARAPGSSVELIDLFANQPARRAFLAGRRAERTALVRVAADVVLAHPGLSLRLSIDGRELLNHQPSEHGDAAGTDDGASLRNALASVFGSAAAQRAIFVESDHDDEALRLDGFAGAPEDSRRNRDAIRIFVNGRGIQDRRLSYAIQEAYRDWLPAGRFPLAVFRLQVPADEVDVNVHPAKSEVKLLHADRAFGLVQRSLREALAQHRAHAPVRLGLGSGLHSRPDLEYADESGGPFAPFQAPLERSPRSALPVTGAHPPELTSAPKSALPPLRTVGQLHRTFIVAEGPNGLVLIDQHGAHERVIYERLLAARANQDSTAQQPLLVPVVIRLDAAESAAWHDSADALNNLGFAIEPFAERALRIRALPAALPSVADAEQLLRGVLADLSADDRPPQRFDPVAASAACHGSVRRGAPMDAPSMSALLRDLERCRNPHSCPHGRPTLVEIAADDLWREFGRT
jgi:DNA mismatch repair protein MutL